MTELISDSDKEAFQKKERVFLRNVVEETPPRIGGERSPSPEIQRELGRSVLEKLQIAESDDRATFAACCVEVNRRDGMSWSAQSCCDRFRAEFPNFSIVVVSRSGGAAVSDRNDLPAVAGLVDVGRLFKLAATHDRSFRKWGAKKIASVVAAVVLSGVVAIVAAIAKDFTAAHPWFYALLGLPPALGAFLAARRPGGNDEQSRSKLTGWLNTLPWHHPFWTDLIRNELPSRQAPRLVVVDHYQRLDALSQELIGRYFGDDGTDHVVTERWLVFEERSLGRPLSAELPRCPLNSRGASTAVLVQQPLSPEERLRLAALVGQPENATFSSVKAVCAGPSPDEAVISNSLAQNRLHHPEKEGVLDERQLLFLLTLASADQPTHFETTYLKEQLQADKWPLRGEVLGAIFPKARFTVTAIDTGFKHLRERLAFMLVDESETGRGSVGVKHEVSSDILRESGRLGLPDAERGHLFWALFWHDFLDVRRRREARWIQQLAYHLARASTDLPDAGERREELEALVRARVFEATLVAVDAGIGACVLQEIPALLEGASRLIDAGFANVESARKRFAVAAWNTYAVLGQSPLLELVLRSWRDDGASRDAEPLATAALVRLYCDTRQLSAGERAVLGRMVTTEPSDGGSIDSPLTDQVRVRAAEASMITAPFALAIDGLDLHAAATEALNAIDGLTERTLSRLERAGENATPVTEGMTLSTAVWCQGLRFTRALREIAIRNATSGAGDDQQVNLIIAHLATAAADLDKLTAVVRRTLVVASRFVAPPTRASDREAAYLQDAIGRELYAVALATMLVAHQEAFGLFSAAANRGHHALATSLVEIVGQSRDFFGCELAADRLGEPGAWTRLVADAGTLLNLASIIWRRFGVETAADALLLRRFHLQSLSIRKDASELTQHNELVQAHRAAPRESLKGLLADLILAEGARSSGEIAAHYVCQAAEAALNGSYGDGLKRELALLALAESHVFGFNLRPFVDHLLGDGHTAQVRLLELLQQVRIDKVADIILILYNAAKGSATRRRMVAEFKRILPSLEQHDGSDGPQALLEAFCLEEEIDQDRVIDPAAVLAKWVPWRDKWVYAWMLTLLVRAGHIPQVRHEAVATLRREPARDNSNVYLNLALAVSNHLGSAREETDVVVNYVNGSIERLKRNVPAETNVRAYQLLSRQGAGFERCRDEVVKWELIKLESDHLQVLPRLTQAGRYFQVFEQYCLSMMYWGLVCDEPTSFWEKRDRDVAGRQMALEEWRATGRAVPDPLPGGRTTSARFLQIGHLLNSRPAVDDPGFDEARAQFDARARQAMQSLLNMIVNLPALPSDVRRLLSNHAQRLHGVRLVTMANFDGPKRRESEERLR